MEEQTFLGLDIKPEILEVLGKLKYTVPTPIQSQAIPVAIKGNDVIGIAQTGTGKTLAFGIPTIQKLMASNQSALIILPTRELALQVEESLIRIARCFNLRSAVLIGGQNMNKQLRDLKSNPRIIISTPGRLIDHLERKTIKLDRVGILVLDEADRMLDMGFEPQVKRILQEVPKERQTMLFSATMPVEIVKIANQYMKTPLRVEVAPAGSATENVTHEIFFVSDRSKLALMESILKERQGSILVFSRTKFGAKRIAFAIRKMGHTATEIHSNRTLAQRMAALDGFKKGKFRVMVATDIAARGIDVKGIEVVINYDLPDSPEDYVHRIGRTGRADCLGHAISFATPKQTYDIRIIEKLIKKTLPVSKLPENMNIDPSIMDGAPERGGRNNDNGRHPQRSYDAPSRGRTASGSRYSKPARSGSDRPSFAPGSDRRGFLKKRPDTKRSEPAHSNEYGARKINDDFYSGGLIKSSDYVRSDARDNRPRPQTDAPRRSDDRRPAHTPNVSNDRRPKNDNEFVEPTTSLFPDLNRKRKGGMPGKTFAKSGAGNRFSRSNDRGRSHGRSSSR
jgi:ATP-dependent RNA helicase RhlE